MPPRLQGPTSLDDAASIDNTIRQLFGVDGDAEFFANGSVAAVSVANTGRIRYNEVTNTFEVSENGGAYVDLSVGGNAFLQDGNSFGATAVIGTNDAFDLVIETAGVERVRWTESGGIAQERMSGSGTAAVPSYSWGADPDTGIFGSAADVVGITTGGTLRFSVGTANVISTLASTWPLGTAALPAYSFTGDTDTGVAAPVANQLALVAGGASSMIATTTQLMAGFLGTAALPAWSFSGDADTGIYSPSANAISLVTAGFERFRIDSGGAMLTLQIGSAGLPAWTFIGDSNTGIFSSGADTLNFTTAGVERGRFTSTGEFNMVSLGTVALPAYSFTGDTNTGMFSTGADVLNFATNGIEAARFTSLGVFRMGAGGSAAAPAISVTGDTNTGIAWTAADTLVFSTGGVDRIAIDSSGFVGIGTATPAVMLDVVGGIATRATSPAALAVGATNDYAIGAGTFFRVTPDAAGSAITGLTGGVDGKYITIINLGAGTLSFTNQDAGSSAANRIITSTGATVTLNTNGRTTLIYDATTLRWRMLAAI